MQAKAAVAAGNMILLRRLGVQPRQIDRVILAGGFADAIDVAHAVAIGMLPAMAPDRVEKAGNAAARGARDLLLSLGLRKSLEVLVQSIHHVELETEPDFFELYVDCLPLRPLPVCDAAPSSMPCWL